MVRAPCPEKLAGADCDGGFRRVMTEADSCHTEGTQSQRAACWIDGSPEWTAEGRSELP